MEHQNKSYYLLIMLFLFIILLLGCKKTIETGQNENQPPAQNPEMNNQDPGVKTVDCPGACKTTCLPNEKRVLCIKKEGVCPGDTKCCADLDFNCSSLPGFDSNNDSILETCSNNCVDIVVANCTDDFSCISGTKCCNGRCIDKSITCCGDGHCSPEESCTICPSDCGKCEASTCRNDTDCMSRFCVHGTCREAAYFCADTFCDWKKNETYENCPNDCCYSDCSSADSLCHIECDNYNGCDFFLGCDKKNKFSYSGCADPKNTYTCCQGFTQACGTNNFCLEGKCAACSKDCDGKCSSATCCGIDPDCDVFGKVNSCSNLASPACVKGKIDPLYQGLCITRNTISISREGNRVLKECCSGLVCDDSRQGCFDPDTSKELCEHVGYIWKGENCNDASRCCGDDCFPTDCNYTCQE